jgi:ankyrin repeat protein
MSERSLPVRPDLEQLRRQAKELLAAVRAGEPGALAELARHHKKPVAASTARLAQAQHALARRYGVASWPRLVLACRLTDAIWRDDVEAVRALIGAQRALLDEDARGVPGNWGPPLSYAANLGRWRILELLLRLGAKDLDHALERAVLQGEVAVAGELLKNGARARPGIAMGPCETLDARGLGFVVELGLALADEHGDPRAPLALVLQTYSRRPQGKHACLELLERAGLELPDTPTMAVHRGRVELLARHLARDTRLFERTFSHGEIWPRELGCAEDESLALHGAPLAGGTLLHLAVDYDEEELARWMLAHGAPADARAAVDAHGFGGHTPLFGCVVSQPWRVGARRDDGFARLLLEHGADPSARASLAKRLRFVDDETRHEYRQVTPHELGQRFHDQDWVSRPVMALLAARAAGA